MKSESDKEYLGHRCIRRHRKVAVIVGVQGCFVIVLGVTAFLKLANPAMAFVLIALGLLVIIGALLLMVASYFFDVGYRNDTELLVKIAAIGPAAFPLTGKWWQQFHADRFNKHHRFGLFCEAGAIFVWIIAIFWFSVYFPRTL